MGGGRDQGRGHGVVEWWDIAPVIKDLETGDRGMRSRDHWAPVRGPILVHLLHLLLATPELAAALDILVLTCWDPWFLCFLPWEQEGLEQLVSGSPFAVGAAFPVTPVEVNTTLKQAEGMSKSPW